MLTYKQALRAKRFLADAMWVQVPPPAPKQKGPANIFLFVGFLFARQHWGAGRARRGQRLCGLHLYAVDRHALRLPG